MRANRGNGGRRHEASFREPQDGALLPAVQDRAFRTGGPKPPAAGIFPSAGRPPAHAQRQSGGIDALRGVSAPLVIGFALCQTWNILCVALPDPITYSAPFHDLRWVSLTTCAGLLLLSAIWAEQVQRTLQNRRILFALGAVASLGSFLGPASALQPAFAYPLIYIAAVAVGAGFAFLPLAWYDQFCLRRDMMGLALSVAATAILTYGLANMLTTDLVNTWVSSQCWDQRARTLVSMALLVYGAKGRPVPPDPDGETRERSLADLLGNRAPEACEEATDPTAPSANLAVCGSGANRTHAESVSADAFGADAAAPPSDNRAILLRFCLCMLVVIAAIEAVRNLLLSGTALTFYAGAAQPAGAGAQNRQHRVAFVPVRDLRLPRGVPPSTASPSS